MKQRVLSIKQGKKTIVSKPWDFEAMCLVDDAKRSNRSGTLRSAVAAVYYLFEGTEVTGETLDTLAPSALSKLCMQVHRWYTDDIAEALKNG